VFKISEQIFEHYKCRAAAMLLDMQFQMEANPPRKPFPQGNKYETLLQQRHIQVSSNWLKIGLHFVSLKNELKISRSLIKIVFYQQTDF